MSQRNSKSLNMPLDDAELDFLDQFLLNRFDDDVDTEGKDEGVFDIATLDGLLTAVVSAPRTIMPSQWLPSLWGDFPQIWNTAEEFESVYSLLIRHMNSIAALLIDQPENFEPIFYTREVKGKTYTIVDEWCEGYMRGVALGAADWLAGGDDTMALLAPIVAFTKAGNWRAHDCNSEEVENLQAAIAVNVRELHDYWLVRRPSADSSAAQQRRTEPKIGRNAPCPCGSGKKFKHCCLH